MGRIIEIKTVNVIQIRTLFEVLKEILIEAPIEIVADDMMNKLKDKDDDVAKKKLGKTEEGYIRITSMDPAQTVLIQVTLFARQFDMFKCKQKVFDAGINLIQLHKLLKELDKDDILTIFVDENDKQNLSFEVTNSEKHRFSTFKLKFIDIDKLSCASNIKFESEVKINSSDFHKICRNMNSISTNMEILCTKSTIRFKCRGDSSEKTTSLVMDKNGSLKDGVIIKFANDVDKENIIQGIFDLKHLIIFSKCQTICKYITLYLANEMQLCMEYKIGSFGVILIAIAPVNKDTITDKTISDDEKLYDEIKETVKMK